MTTTVIMLSNDEAHNLRRSLPLAAAQPDARVLVIDNGCVDGTAGIAAQHGAQCLRLRQRLSYCEAMNAAFARVESDSVLFLNADCFLDPRFLSAALPRLREPGVGSVAPKLLRTLGADPEDRLDRIDAVGIVMHRCRKNLLAGHDAPLPAFDVPAEVFGADGAAALYRVEVLRDCAAEGHLFDPRLELWGSDVDLAWRTRLNGWRCVYEPAAVAHHMRTYRPGTRDRMPRRHRRLMWRNRYLLIAKNDRPGDLLRDLPVILAYELLALGHALVREPHLLLAYLAAIRQLPGLSAGRRNGRRRDRARPRLGFGRIPPRLGRGGPGLLELPTGDGVGGRAEREVPAGLAQGGPRVQRDRHRQGRQESQPELGPGAQAERQT
jgi:GT2 family glycosyltransferase